jgi:hypothetical protein
MTLIFFIGVDLNLVGVYFKRQSLGQILFNWHKNVEKDFGLLLVNL